MGPPCPDVPELIGFYIVNILQPDKPGSQLAAVVLVRCVGCFRLACLGCEACFNKGVEALSTKRIERSFYFFGFYHVECEIEGFIFYPTGLI